MSLSSALEPRPALSRALLWALGVFLFGLLALLLGDLWALAVHTNFAIDEFGYAHAAYAIAHGQVPYRDFYEIHFPLNYELLSLLFRFGAEKPSAILDMRLVMLGWAALTLFSSWLLCLRYGALRALLAPISILVVVPLWLYAYEIRHDPVGLALLLLALGLRELPGHPRLTSALAGAAWVLCLWSTQKALMFAGTVLVPALALDLWHKQSGDRAFVLVDPRAWFSGAGAVAAAIVVWLVATRNVGSFIFYCFAQAGHYQEHYARVSLTEQLLPMLNDAAMVLPLVVAGVWGTARGLTRLDVSVATGRDVLLLGALASTFCSYALTQFPFPYAAVPFWGLFGLIAARGVLELWAKPGLVTTVPRQAALVMTLVLLAFVATRAHSLYRTRTKSSNALQLSVLEQVDKLTASDDAFFDSGGYFVARPHSYYYFYIDAILRNEIPDLANEAQRAIVRAEAIGVIPDIRYGGLPLALRSFIESHYQKYSGDLWLYGQSYDASSARGSLPFLAIKSGRYFVNGAAGEVMVDGRPVGTSDFLLTRGMHQIELAHAAGVVQVLWLPKNGEHWRPRPEKPAAFLNIF